MGDDPEQGADPATEAADVSLRTGLALSELELSELWVGVLAIGGTMTQPELQEIIEGTRTPTAYQHDLIAQALNDHFTELGMDHPVAYAHDGDDPPRPPAP